MFSAATILPILVSIAFSTCAPCNEKIYIGGQFGQLAISTDGGETWTRRDPIKGRGVNSISANGENIFVATNWGLAVSNNGGENWKTVYLNPDKNAQWVASVFSTGNKVFASSNGYSGLMGGTFSTSNDNGATWPIQQNVSNSDNYVTAVYASDKRLYVGTGKNGLGVSEDDGKTWAFIKTDKGLAGNFVLSVAGDGNKLYVGANEGGKISVSEDDGKTWAVRNTTRIREGGRITSIFAANGMVYVTSYKGGLSISNDGGKTWTYKMKSDGLASDLATSVAVNGNNVYVGTNDGLSISRDGGNTWTTKKIDFPRNYVSTIFAHCV